jgi:hypothetical protein
VLKLVLAAAALWLLSCRGEPPPRDYQNNPPAMTHPVTNRAQSPAANGMPGAAPEPSRGAENNATKPVEPSPLASKTPVPNTTPNLPPNAVTTMTPPGQPGSGTAGATSTSTTSHPR